MAKPKMTPIRASAKGEDCTLNIAGVCNYNPETTVFCHYPSEDKGMGIKSSDLSGGYACCSCHDVIDDRNNIALSDDSKEWYMRRSILRTHKKLIDKGIMTIKGMK